MSLFRFIPAFTGSATGTYTVSGETGINNTEGGGGFASAGVGVNNATYGGNGTVYKIQGVATAQIDAATDWCIPNALYSKRQVHIKCDDNLANLDAGSDFTGVWLLLSDGSSYDWYVQRQAVGTTNLDVDLSLSLDGGSTVHSTANYTGSVTKV
jgi:hypothetical protein